MGILTDVAYGMPREIVERDLAPFQQYVEVLITSVEVGCRKPDPRGYVALAGHLGVAPADLFYVGNEPKDVEGARRAGCRPVFLAREGESGPDGERRITTLAEIRGWLDGAWPCC